MRAPALAGLLLALGPAAPGLAQGVESASLRLDNDILALRGREAPPDYDYTHGLHLSAGLGSAGAVGRLLSLPPGARAGVGIGQRIYTPREDAPAPLPGERPYAAWLFASAGVEVVEPHRERTLAVELGVTGPPALGEPVQNGIHRLAGSEMQRGWDHQLGFEPGILLRYEDGYVVRGALSRVGAARLVPAWSVTLGNVRTAAGVGASLRLGREAGPGPYGRLDAGRERVFRDLFLDGNTFRGSSPADRLPFVTEGAAGVGYRFRGWSLEYRFVARSREYRAQPGAHRYGSLVFKRTL